MVRGRRWPFIPRSDAASARIVAQARTTIRERIAIPGRTAITARVAIAGRSAIPVRARVRGASTTLSAAIRKDRGDLQAMAQALQALAEVTDARAEICSIVSRAMHADRVVLFEPDGDGITSTASSIAGEEAHHYRWADASSAVQAFRARQRLLVADLSLRQADGAHRIALRQHLQTLGITSAMSEPVIRGGETVAVLSIQFRARHDRVSRRQSLMLEALAAGASSAIGRVDLLSRLEASAGTDALTRLANRRTWEQRVTAAIAASSRDGQHLTIAMLDLDHFKAFNDRFGHLAGDELLTEVAGSLTGTVRGSDLVARWGGEEFAILLQACDLESAGTVARRIMATMPTAVTCSIGLAQRRPDETDHDWLGRADGALMQAKAAGRARTYAATSAEAACTEVSPVDIDTRTDGHSETDPDGGGDTDGGRDDGTGGARVIPISDRQQRADRRRAGDRRRRRDDRRRNA